MDITLIAANLSQNSLGRVILLAQALAANHRTRIVGARFGPRVWAPAKGCGIDILEVPAGNWPGFAFAAMKLIDATHSKLVIACKARLPSYGVALAWRRLYGGRVIVDLDDDEIAMTEAGRSRPLVKDLIDPLGHRYAKWCWKRIPQANGVFSITAEYRDKFGGVVVPHAKDTAVVDPQFFEIRACRQKLGLGQNLEIVAFVGTPRPHKGIDTILEAIKLLDRPSLRLLLVGVEHGNEYVANLIHRYGETIIPFPPQPVTEMPVFLGASNLIALPQKECSAARGQIPAKLFDAMAMGKPIVASRVGAIPSYLQDAGLLVPPDDSVALADAMGSFLRNPELGSRLGQRARTLCVSGYSFSAIRSSMNDEIVRATS